MSKETSMIYLAQGNHWGIETRYHTHDEVAQIIRENITHPVILEFIAACLEHQPGSNVERNKKMDELKRLQIESLKKEDFERFGLYLFEVYEDANNYDRNKSSMKIETKNDIIDNMNNRMNQVMDRVKRIGFYVTEMNILHSAETGKNYIEPEASVPNEGPQAKRKRKIQEWLFAVADWKTGDIIELARMAKSAGFYSQSTNVKDIAGWLDKLREEEIDKLKQYELRNK